MKTMIKITNETKFNELVIDVDTDDLKCTDNFNRTGTFAASGHISIQVEDGESIEATGDHGSSDYEDEFGFVLIPEYTYDVHFNDDEDSNNKGFELTKEQCIDYINTWNGTNESYFEDYKDGVVSVVCNETGETVHEEEIK